MAEIGKIKVNETIYDLADSKARNDVNGVKSDVLNKIDKPSAEDNGKVPRAKDGNVEWVEQEGSGAIQDGSIGFEKLTPEFQEDYNDIKNTLVEQKMLGWSIPKECPVQDINYVDRVAFKDLDFTYNSTKQVFIAQVEGGKMINSSTGNANGYIEGYTLEKRTWSSLSDKTYNLGSNAISTGVCALVIKDLAYADVASFVNANADKFLYYERDISRNAKEGKEIADIINDKLDILKFGEQTGSLNLWDEVWEKGTLSSTGSESASNNAIRGIHYIEVEPLTEYCICTTYNSTIYVCEYDESYNHVYRNSKSSSNKSFTTRENTKFVKIATGTSYGGEYSDKIALIKGTSGKYEPYTPSVKMLSDDTKQLKNDLGGLSLSASGTTLTITDGTNTWTLQAAE